MKKEIKIRQHDRQDCAAACLSSICSYHGLNLPLINIREACGTSQDGTSIQGIIDAAPKVGMSAKAFKSKDKKATDLVAVDKPVILHLQKENGWLHFVVLYEMDLHRAIYMDPEDGDMHKIKLEELEKEWTGYIIVISPAANFSRGDSRTSSLQRFKELFLTNKKELIPAFIGAIVYTAIGLSTSLFLQQIIDKVIPSGDSSMLLFYGAIMLLLAALALFIGYIRSILTVRASVKVDCQLVMGYLNKLLELPVSFFNTRSSGELNSRIGDAYRIRSFLSVRLLVIIISVISLIISVFMLFTYYWKLATLTLLFIPLYYVLYRISDKINKKVNKKIIEESACFQDATIETLNNIRAVKYFDSKESTSERMEGYYVSMAQQLYRGGRNVSAFATSSEGISKLLTFTILVVGTLFVFRSELTTGEMVSFYTIASFFTSPIMSLIESNSQITEAQIAADRLFEIMDLDGEDIGPAVEAPLDTCLDINVEKLQFSFPGRMPLLKDISFTLEKGKINAIVGRNGSGKSTLATLLMRGYSPDSGRITVGDIDISHIPVSRWRKYISIVPQRVDLFNGSILENIVPNESVPDLARVIDICKKAGLEKTILSLPDGLLCRTGEQACRLSGGEKQKIALARALYRQPKALILDEATSSVDIAGKEEISRIIRDLADDGMTIIIISHDCENIGKADNIIEI